MVQVGPPVADRRPLEHGLGAKRAPDVEGSCGEGRWASSASCWQEVSKGQGQYTCVHAQVCEHSLGSRVEMGDFHDHLGPEKGQEVAL